MTGFSGCDSRASRSGHESGAGASEFGDVHQQVLDSFRIASSTTLPKQGQYRRNQQSS